MLDDTTRAYIMLDIKCLTPDDTIITKYGITTGTLKAIKNEYEKIKEMLVGLKTISEIADKIKTTEDYIETIRHIIETDADQLLDEVEQANKEQQDAGKEEPVQEQPVQIQEGPTTDTQEVEDIQNNNNGKGNKQDKPKSKKGEGKGDATKNLDVKLKKTAEVETAAVLVGDAGDIGKSLSLQRQDIGKYVMEQMGTVAMQFGHKDFKQFLDMVYSFFVQNYGRVDDLIAQIEELTIVNQQMQELIDQDIFRMFIAKSLDRVTIAALIGGGKLNLETLFAYKRMLESSGINQNNGGINVYGT